MLRTATSEDCEALLGIYAPYVTGTTVSFETVPPAKAAFRERMQGILGRYPYLVWEEDGRPLGYAYASRYRTREAYRWDAELSIYIDASQTRRGGARQLYTAMLRLLAEQGVYNAYACIALPNDPSIGFHRVMGFSDVGTFRKAGYKFGRWVDVAWMEKRLIDEPPYPAPLTAFRELSPSFIAQTLASDAYEAAASSSKKMRMN